MSKKHVCVGWTVVFALIASFVIAGSAAGSSQPVYGGTFKYVTMETVLTVDPMVTSAVFPFTIGQHMFETLVQSITTGKDIYPELADSWEISDDNLRYTFHLRRGVHFHDGSEMTSEDVLASVERWLEYGGRGGSLKPYVDHLAAPDKYTFEVYLKRPFAPILFLLGYGNGGPVIIPAEIARAAGPEPLAAEQLIGTGPYKFGEWEPGVYVRLDRYDGYKPREETPYNRAGRRIAYFDHVEFLTVPETEARIAGVRNGEYDWAEYIPADLYENLAADPLLRVVKVQPVMWCQIFFNTKEGLCANQTLRQAILATLDMDQILYVAYPPGLGEVDGSIYPKGTPWYTTAGLDKFNQKNPVLGRQLAQQAGYKGEPIRFLVPNMWPFYELAQAATAQLENAGFNIDFQVYDWAGLVARRRQPDKWEMFITGDSPTDVDPAVTYWMSPSYPGWWDTPEKNAILEEFVSTTDFEARYAAWEKFQALFYEQVPQIKLGNYHLIHVIAPVDRLGGVESRVIDLFPYAWNLWRPAG